MEVVEESRLRHLAGKDGLTDRQRKWMRNNAFKGYFKKAGKKHVRCLKCGKLVKDTEKKCPCCGNVKSNVLYAGRLSYRWVLVASVWKKWQVLTTWECVVSAKSKGVHMSVNSIIENWVSTDGGRTILARNKIPMRCDDFDWRTEMTLKRKYRTLTYYGSSEDYLGYGMECPLGRIHPEMKMRGFRMVRLDRLNAISLAMRLPKETMLETVMKLGREDLAYGIMSGRKVQVHCWRLALKYGYRPKNLGTWMDYVEQLEYLGMDTHNPKVLLPGDLARRHQELTERVNRKRDKERKEREREECRKNLERYRKEKQMFLDLQFEGRGIRFHVLQSPEEFLDEGRYMHHCVASYWSHGDCIILSARDEENCRLETVEVSLKSFDIIQSQGPCNKPTLRHEDIKSVVMENMMKIRECAMNV